MSSALSLILQFSKDFLRLYARDCTKVGVLVMATVLLQLPVPILTMYIIDNAITTPDTNLLTKVVLLLACLIILKHVFSYINDTLTLRLRENIILNIEGRLVSHVQRLPLSFFSNKHSSYLQTRIMGDARGVEGALIRTLVSIVVDGLTFLVGISLIMFIRYQLGLLLFVFLLPFAYLRYFADEKMRVLSRQMQETQAVTSAIVSESFSGIRTIKAYVREPFQEQLITRQLKALRDIYIETNWFGVVSMVGASFLTSLCVAFVLWDGCRSVIAGRMTLGEVVAVLSLLNFLYGPINSLVATNLRIQQAASALQRIYEYLNEPRESSDGMPLKVARGAIAFNDVSFAYSGGSEVLKNISFAIEPGKIVALVGRTGAGKSTVVNLLLRFYDTGMGNVFIDGVDIRDFSLDSLRESIGVVDQQPFLFSGTILDNIRFGNPEATLEEIMTASKLSYADEFIEKLPDKYDTRVGERGVRLSGGQCQRIALARMFLKDPKILILDEAVSAIDSESEAYIRRALVPLVANRTTIVIAHRLSSLLLADHVIVLDSGTVVEQGSHQILMDSNGVYFKLFQEQFITQLRKDSQAGSTAFVS